jgi:DNA-binding LacI/PurR family transcriptional regulator
MHDDSIIRSIVDTKFPFVVIENYIQDLNINCVMIDNFNGAYKATEHLIKLGHRNIMHFAGNRAKRVSSDRLNGYLTAMHDNLINVSDDMIINSDYTEENGYRDMKRLLGQNIKPTALFCADDTIAVGAITAIYEAGLSVPGDIAVIGFDDDKSVRMDRIFPALTTVRQPLIDIGAASIKLLVKHIKNPMKKPEKILFKTELIIRDSCGGKRLLC